MITLSVSLDLSNPLVLLICLTFGVPLVVGWCIALRVVARCARRLHVRGQNWLRRQLVLLLMGDDPDR